MADTIDNDMDTQAKARAKTRGGAVRAKESAANGDAMGNDMDTQTKAREYRFDEASGFFWKKVCADVWIGLREGAFRRELKVQGFREKAMAMNGELVSPMDKEIHRVEQRARVKFACALAGYKAGVHVVGGEEILVTRSVPLILPRKGEWPLLGKVLDGLFVGTEMGGDGQPFEMDQRDRWLAYMQHWLQSLYGGYVTRGLCLCIAGEPNSGKTLLAKIMKTLTGGKEGKPYDFMIGRDNFNRELFESSLQLIDDENADTRIEARRAFGAQIKKIVGNDDMKLRGMHRDGIILSPTWRIVALVNLEAERLMVMPPIENDIADKILMLKGYQRPRPIDGASEEERRCWPMPMPTDTPREQQAFWAALEAEFPAFVHFLLEEYQSPSQVAGGRLGVREWQHPEILRELQQFSPHVRLWQLIMRSNVVFHRLTNPDAKADEPPAWEDFDDWRGTADELDRMLRGEHSKLTTEERRELPKPSWLGQQLKAAARFWGPSAVEYKRTGKARTWVLHKRPDLVN